MGRLLSLRNPGFAVALLILTASLASAQDRPPIGVAFGGGGARGLAHVGVIKWLEEHHIPIDMTAGTSMGALVAGFFATGLSAAELETLLRDMDWNDVFASSGFNHKNLRRKDDARTFPLRLEFGLKGGLNAPTSPNTGQQVGLLLSRIAAPYHAVTTFDDLPTPARMVAVDLLTARTVVLDRGSLAMAMRASMAVPGLFPPVALDGRILVDGGILNNMPADVVRGMGARQVIAVNVADLANPEGVNRSTFGLMAASLDAMVRANSRAALEAADVIVNIPLDGFRTLEFGRSAALIQLGYESTNLMRDRLLPFAVSDAEWARWLERRRTARKPSSITPTFIVTKDLGGRDASRLERRLQRHLGRPLDVGLLEYDLAELSGLDRYETVSWQLTSNNAGEIGLEARGSARPYSPPYLMLGFTLENTTSDQFRVSMLGRFLTFDVIGSGSELRIDATAGSDPGAAASLYAPLAGRTFIAPFAGISTRTFSVVEGNAVVARYGQHTREAGLEFGLNIGRNSDLRVGAAIGHVNAEVKVGDPGLPELSGRQLTAGASWRLDTQDRPVVPTHGVLARASYRHFFEGPSATAAEALGRSSAGLDRLSAEANQFWTIGDSQRVFVLVGGGASFHEHPLSIDRFTLGSPMHLGVFDAGKLVGDHYVIATAGYLRQLSLLPDFIGGPVFAGAWLETGDAFDTRRELAWQTNVSAGLVMDSLVGPMLLGGSYGSGHWRAYVSIGRMFR